MTANRYNVPLQGYIYTPPCNATDSNVTNRCMQRIGGESVNLEDRDRLGLQLWPEVDA